MVDNPTNYGETFASLIAKLQHAESIAAKSDDKAKREYDSVLDTV